MRGSATVSVPPPRPGSTLAAVPVSYWVWLTGTTVSMLGTQILAFGMAWIATGRGGLAASLVVTGLGLLADAVAPAAVIGLCAVAAAGTAVASLRSAALRAAVIAPG